MNCINNNDINKYKLKASIAQRYHTEMSQSDIFQFMWEWDRTCDSIKRHVEWIKEDRR